MRRNPSAPSERLLHTPVGQGAGTPVAGGAGGLPSVDPFGDALAHIFAVEKQGDSARALERRECLDHRQQFHSVVGGAQLSAKKLFFGGARAQQHAPAARPGVALARPVGVNLYLVHSLFLSIKVMSVALRATGMEAVARCRWVRHAGSISRMPCTRLTPTTKYPAPRIGQHRSPTRSIHAKRSIQCSERTAGR